MPMRNEQRGFGMGGGFAPDRIADLTLWLDAADTATITQAGGMVSAWQDKSGSGNDVVQGTPGSEPITGLNTMGGRNVITFDGANDFLDKVSFAGNTNMTLFIVAKVLSAGSEFEAILTMSSSPNDFQIDAGVNGQFLASFRSSNLGATVMPMHASDLTGKPSLISYRLSATDGAVTLRVDGVESASDTYNGALTLPTRFILGQNRAFNFPANVDIAEVVIYNRDLPLPEINAVERYLLRWGIVPVAGVLASLYDGVNDYQTRGADLTGNADGKKMLISFFLRLESPEPGADQVIFDNVGVRVQRSDTNQFIFFVSPTVGGIDLIFSSQPTIVEADGLWHHILLSADLGSPGSAHLYIDDVETTTLIFFNNAVLKYSQPDHAIGAQTDGSDKLHGSLSELYINFAEHLDPTVEANRRLFVSASLEPAFLGLNGELPTGASPLIYAPNGDATQNRGSGGDFTTTGDLDRVAGPGA